jgi:biotin carboxylase
MKKVLLADTNISSEPIYRFLSGLGFEVHTVGVNDHDYLAQAGPRHHKLNYSDLLAFRAFILENGFDFLVPGCNDVSYMSCAAVAPEFGFPGFDSVEVTENINDKSRFRRLGKDLGLHAPAVFEDISDVSRWPVIVKPVDAYSGRGITVIDRISAGQLSDAVKLAASYSRSGSFLIEQKVSGQLYSHSAFLENGEFVFDVIVEEHGSVNPFAVDTSRVLYDFSHELLQDIRTDILKLAVSQGITTGLIHTQFMADGDRFWLIEVTRRCPGDLYAELIRRSTGYAYAENYARPFIGLSPEKNLQYKTELVVRHTLNGTVGRPLRDISFSMYSRSVVLYPLLRAGSEISGNLYGRIALIFALCTDRSEQDRLMNSFLERTAYRIE